MADLLAQWGAANIVGPDWLPRIVQAGLSLKNDRERLGIAQQEVLMRQQALTAEQARYARQEDFQERKMMYGMKQDQLDRARQSLLDDRSWQVQQAQMRNMDADNARAATAADHTWQVQQAQMKNMQDDNARQKARFDWETEQKDGGFGGLMNWIQGGNSSSSQSWQPSPTIPKNSFDFNSPFTGALGGSIGSDQPGASIYQGVYGVDPAITNAKAPETTGLPTSEASIGEHPGKAKYEFLQRAATIDPRLVWNMKTPDRDAALQIIGKANALKDDPDVLDYQAKMQQTNDTRTAARQKDMIQHYYGADLPIGGAALSPGMQRLNRGLPVDDWNAAADSEISAQNDVLKRADALTAQGFDFFSSAADAAAGLGAVSEKDRKREMTPDRVIEAKQALAAAKERGENREWDNIKSGWTKENPALFRTVVEVASKKDATLKDLEKALYETVGNDISGARPGARTKYYHPDPSKRKAYKTDFPGLGWLLDSTVDKVNGEPLSNFDIASILFDEVRRKFDTFPAPQQDGKTPSGNGFTIGAKVEEK